MTHKIFKVVFLSLVLLGIGISICNFVVPSLQAGDVFYGTDTEIEDGEPNPDNPAWLYDNHYCVGTESNCSVVFAI